MKEMPQITLKIEANETNLVKVHNRTCKAITMVKAIELQIIKTSLKSKVNLNSNQIKML